MEDEDGVAELSEPTEEIDVVDAVDVEDVVEVVEVVDVVDMVDVVDVDVVEVVEVEEVEEVEDKEVEVCDVVINVLIIPLLLMGYCKRWISFIGITCKTTPVQEGRGGAPEKQNIWYAFAVVFAHPTAPRPEGAMS